MANAAMIAFLCEVFGATMQQWAFIMQKLAHRKLELHQKRNLVNTEQSDSDKDTDDY